VKATAHLKTALKNLTLTLPKFLLLLQSVIRLISSSSSSENLLYWG